MAYRGIKGTRVLSLMREMITQGNSCPAHATCSHLHPINSNLLRRQTSSMTPETLKEYAVEMACSNIRYGPGVSAEIGMDAKNFNSKHALLMTDKAVASLPPFKLIIDALTKENIKFDVFDDVSIEPTDKSFQKAVDFARQSQYDLFLAVGGGSVIDTCKVANLFSVDREASLLDYANKPYGKGRVINQSLHNLIAVPTTAGTGSETTGVAVFDYKPLKVKIGIASRVLRPTLGLVDPDFMRYMPNRVAAYSGFDVFCHALESYTAIPYNERVPRPSNPNQRPAYQGSNPISDVWSKHALHIISKYFRRAVADPEDTEARSEMHLASSFAGIGFGNAGVHLCHGMSYPVSGLVPHHMKDPVCAGYPNDKPIIPHGLSVVMSAPAVFSYTAPLCPERHLEVATILDPSLAGKKLNREDAGFIISDVVLKYMQDLEIPNGLTALGFTQDDIPALVKGTLPQERVVKLAPRPTAEEDLHQLFSDIMTVY